MVSTRCLFPCPGWRPPLAVRASSRKLVRTIKLGTGFNYIQLYMLSYLSSLLHSDTASFPILAGLSVVLRRILSILLSWSMV